MSFFGPGGPYLADLLSLSLSLNVLMLVLYIIPRIFSGT